MSLNISFDFSPIKVVYLQMAFMAMRKNLDERARKKEFDEIFLKFDHNRNGKWTARKLLMHN